MSVVTQVLSAPMILIGLAIVVRTLAEGGGGRARAPASACSSWRPAPVGCTRSGDVTPLGKSLGAPALFGIVQGFVAASVYFAVGLVAQRALGFTWLVFLAGGLLFALVVLSYVEGRRCTRSAAARR